MLSHVGGNGITSRETNSCSAMGAAMSLPAERPIHAQSWGQQCHYQQRDQFTLSHGGSNVITSRDQFTLSHGGSNVITSRETNSCSAMGAAMALPAERPIHAQPWGQQCHYQQRDQFTLSHGGSNVITSRETNSCSAMGAAMSLPAERPIHAQPCGRQCHYQQRDQFMLSHGGGNVITSRETNSWHYWLQTLTSSKGCENRKSGIQL